MAIVKVPTSVGRSVQVQPLDNAPLRYAESRNLVGESVERLGQQMAGFADSLHDLHLRKAEYAAKDAALEWGDEKERLIDNPETGLYRLQGKPALESYESVLEDLDKKAGEISANLGSPDARRMFDDNVAARKQALRAQVGSWVVNVRQRYEDEVDTSLLNSTATDAARAWDDDEESEVNLATMASIIARMANRKGSLEWAQDQIEQRESAVRRDIALARTTNLSPDAGEAYFTAHKDAFAPDDARAVQSAVRVRREALAAEERRIAAEQRAAAAAAKAEQRERLETMRTQLETGAGSSADWVALADGYAAIGDTSSAASARAKAGETRAAESYRGVPIPTLDRDIAALEAKEGRLSPSEASKLNGLRSVREQTAARLNQPGGAMRQEQYASGKVIAPLDFNDPDSFQARATYAVAAAKRQGGRIEPFFGEELRRLEGAVAGEASERLSALRTIALFRDPRAIEGAARQLTTDADGEFRIAATLISSPGGERTALEILRGRDALATSEKAYNGGLAQMAFNSAAGPALVGMPPDYSRDVFDAARSIYGERARQRNVTSWNPQLWRDSINAALGGETKGGAQYGGVVTFKGKPVSIPPGWQVNDVFHRLSIMGRPETAKAAVTDAPFWPDGKPVTIGQLRDLTPVRLGGTRYGFQTRGGRLLGTKSGRPYTLDVSKLPRKK